MERSEGVGFAEHIFENVTSYKQLHPAMVEGIKQCVIESGIRTTDEDVLDTINGDLVQVFTDNMSGKVFAFSSTAFVSPREHFDTEEFTDEKGCHLVGAAISKDRQGSGFYKEMNTRRIREGIDRGYNLVFTQTQNPRVQSGIESVLNDMQNRGEIEGYSLNRNIRRGAYGSMLTAEKPIDSKLLFDELNYDSGDAYILLFQLQRGKESSAPPSI